MLMSTFRNKTLILIMAIIQLEGKSQLSSVNTLITIVLNFIITLEYFHFLIIKLKDYISDF